MAMDIPWNILKRKDLQPLEKLTLSVLYLHATPKKLVVYPKNNQLIECTGLSSRAIARHMAKLESLGLIERIRKGSHERDVRLLRGVPPVSRDSSGTCHQWHVEQPPVAVDNTIGKNQLTNQREVEQESDPLTAANGAQPSLPGMPQGGAERPDPKSELEQVIEKFNRERKNVNDYLVVQGQFKEGASVRTVRPYGKEDGRLKKLVKLHGAEPLCAAVDELATGIANGKNAEKFVYFAWKTFCRPGYVEDLLNRSDVRDSVELQS